MKNKLFELRIDKNNGYKYYLYDDYNFIGHWSFYKYRLINSVRFGFDLIIYSP